VGVQRIQGRWRPAFAESNTMKLRVGRPSGPPRTDRCSLAIVSLAARFTRVNPRSTGRRIEESGNQALAAAQATPRDCRAPSTHGRKLPSAASAGRKQIRLPGRRSRSSRGLPWQTGDIGRTGHFRGNVGRSNRNVASTRSGLQARLRRPRSSETATASSPSRACQGFARF